MVDFQIVVIVPGLARAVPHLNEAHAFFNQAPRDEQLPGLRPVPVQLANMFRLAADVERVRGVHLHPVSQFKRLNARLQLRVLLALLQMPLVEFLQQTKLIPLFPRRRAVVSDVLDELFNPGVLRVDVGALKNPRQKAGLPVL